MKFHTILLEPNSELEFEIKKRKRKKKCLKLNSGRNDIACLMFPFFEQICYLSCNIFRQLIWRLAIVINKKNENRLKIMRKYTERSRSSVWKQKCQLNVVYRSWVLFTWIVIGYFVSAVCCILYTDNNI